MSAQFWMGTAIGMMVIVLTLFIFLLSHRGMTKEQKRDLGEANELLRIRNTIGIRQCEALEAISGVINAGSDTPKEAEELPTGITIKIRKGTEEHAEYLNARFPKDQIHSPCFKLHGHNWRYEYSSSDDQGEFDLLWRPAEDEQSEELAIMTRQKECWQAETIRLENDLTRTREERDRLKIYADHLLDCIEPPPDKNCSCHISPPCSDCVDYGGLRNAIADMKSVIGAVESRAE